MRQSFERPQPATYLTRRAEQLIQHKTRIYRQKSEKKSAPGGMLDITAACHRTQAAGSPVGSIARILIQSHITGESIMNELSINLIHGALALILALTPLVAAAYLDWKQKHQP
jgi:hypothetical protein